MNTDRKRADRISDTQKDIILAFMKDDLQFAAGKFDENLSPSKALLKWRDLTNILNTFPGPKKDWRSWKKTWQDMRSKAKRKALTSMVQNGKIRSLSKIQEGILAVVQMSEELHGNCDENNCDDEIFMNNDSKSFKRDLSVDSDNLGNSASPLNINEDVEIGENKERINLLLGNETINELPEQKDKISINYYERKLAALEKIAAAKERSVKAKEKIASELSTISELLTKLVDK
ncbi:uncharacterized protein LOC123681744 [Harmonia axyridis]|uniref:uncharacterized protein LOC123681744 n=1 Tax=Harmonia axyridis TaxID=115357 RepID=UPI001E278C66|nr:uncharacterized protein LOC123681744 [Harmonia axyridis]